MSQLQKVSWRTVGYTALGSVVAIASVVAIVKSDGVRPTSLTSSSATRWLVSQVNKQAVLVDGLAGRVVAKINTDSEASDEVAVQGVGGAFLLSPTQASVRTISTSKLQLGTPQTVGLLSEAKVKYRVGDNGLTVVNSVTDEASLVPGDDAPRPFEIPKSDTADIATDGSMWLFTRALAQHVNVDESVSTVPLSSNANQTTTVGTHAVAYDATRRVVHWMGGRDLSLFKLGTNASEAVLQEPGDDAPCVWLGFGSTLVCVGPTGIDQTLDIAGMNISVSAGDRLAIAGPAAVVVGPNNEVQRIDLQNKAIAAGRLTSECSRWCTPIGDHGQRRPGVARRPVRRPRLGGAALRHQHDRQEPRSTGARRPGPDRQDGRHRRRRPVVGRWQLVQRSGRGGPPRQQWPRRPSARGRRFGHRPGRQHGHRPGHRQRLGPGERRHRRRHRRCREGRGPRHHRRAQRRLGVLRARYRDTAAPTRSPTRSSTKPATTTPAMVNVELFAADSANRPPIARDDRVEDPPRSSHRHRRAVQRHRSRARRVVDSDVPPERQRSNDHRRQGSDRARRARSTTRRPFPASTTSPTRPPIRKAPQAPRPR